MSPRSIVSLLLLAGLSLSAGCQSTAKPSGDAEVAPPSAQDAAAIRERYQQINASNRLGVVIAVRAESNLAAVGDIPVQDFGIGDVLTFIDSAEQPFNTGEVVNATPSALHVRYEADRRAPREGDLAVRLR